MKESDTAGLPAKPAESGAEPALKRRRFAWSLKWTIALISFVGFVGALFVGWVVLFEEVDSKNAVPVLPGSNAVVLTLEPTFQWPGGNGPWLFSLEEEGAKGEGGFEKRTESNRLILPEGVLRPDRAYRWRVVTLDRSGEEEDEVVVRRLRTQKAAVSRGGEGDLWVYPSQYVLRRRHFYSPLALEVRFPGGYHIELPDELVFMDGRRGIDAHGSAVFSLQFAPSMAGNEVAEWGEVIVSAPGEELTIPLSLDPVDLGELLETGDPGFWLYEDTPAFSNFEESVLARLTQGTCVGIAMTVKLFFERARYGGGVGEVADNFGPVAILKALVLGRPLVFEGVGSFRELSQRRAGLLRDIMSQLHLENLNPLNARSTMAEVLRLPSTNTEEAIWRSLRRGDLAVVAGFRLRRKVLKAAEHYLSFAVLDSGHVFLVYRGWRFGQGGLFAVCDPNYEYGESGARQTLLVYPRGSRPQYRVNGELREAMVRFVVLDSAEATSLLVLALESSRQKFGEVLKKLRGVRP